MPNPIFQWFARPALPENEEALSAWLNEERSASELIRLLREVPGYLRETAAVEVARYNQQWNPRLIKVVLRADMSAAPALAQNPGVSSRASVQMLLDECMRAARTYHPEAPFGIYPDWENFKAVLSLLRAGKVTFRHEGISRARHLVRRHPDTDWARLIVAADQHTPASLLKRIAERFLHRPSLSRERQAVIQDLLEPWLRLSVKGNNGRNEKQGKNLNWQEEWRLLVAENPSAAARLLREPLVRARLTVEDMGDLLSSPDANLRLAALIATSEPSIIAEKITAARLKKDTTLSSTDLQRALPKQIS